jgi:hypothetical protein
MSMASSAIRYGHKTLHNNMLHIMLINNIPLKIGFHQFLGKHGLLNKFKTNLGNKDG